MFWVPCCSFLYFFVLFCYLSLCSEFRVAYFFCFFRVVLLCICMFWIPCCLFLLLFSCCPVMCLYVLSSVLLISLVFFVLSCYVSLCSEFRVAYFFSFFRVVLLCVFMFWVPCCSFHKFVLFCPVMYLYVLSSVLLISLGFFCVVLLCICMFSVPCCSFL